MEGILHINAALPSYTKYTSRNVIEICTSLTQCQCKGAKMAEIS